LVREILITFGVWVSAAGIGCSELALWMIGVEESGWNGPTLIDCVLAGKRIRRIEFLGDAPDSFSLVEPGTSRTIQPKRSGPMKRIPWRTSLCMELRKRLGTLAFSSSRFGVALIATCYFPAVPFISKEHHTAVG
jgi:hypothetical protein